MTQVQYFRKRQEEIVAQGFALLLKIAGAGHTHKGVLKGMLSAV